MSKLQLAIGFFFIAVVVFIASVLFFSASGNQEDSIADQSLAVQESGFLVSPDKYYNDTGYTGPAAEEYLASTHELITGTVTETIFSSGRFADFSEDYSNQNFMTLTIEGPEADSTVFTLEDPDEILIRTCESRNSPCTSFSDFEAGVETLIGVFEYRFVGAITEGDEIIIAHRVLVGSLDNALDISSSYDVYVTRYEN